MKTVCELNKCVGCHACKDLCPREGKKFNLLVMKCCTQKWFRQFVKRQLIRAKIIGGTYSISYTRKS